jgi:broad specificity phosphatase PhoE
MLRTEQTLNAMYGDIDHHHEPLLKEINLGKYEMKTYSEIMEDDYGRAWLSGELETLSFEGGDSHEGFNRRVTEGVWNILREAEKAGKDRVIAVLHGAVITYLMNNAFPDQYEDMWMWTPNPGTGYKVVVKDGRPVSWSTVGETGERIVPM